MHAPAETLETYDNLPQSIAPTPTTERLGALGMIDGIDYFAAADPKSGNTNKQGGNNSSTPKTSQGSTPVIPRSGGGTGRSI